jgi:hypothetical protein
VARDRGPSISELALPFDDHLIFPRLKGIVPNGWGKMIAPALAALLGSSVRDNLCNVDPFFGPEATDGFPEEIVFCLTPDATIESHIDGITTAPWHLKDH